MAGTKSDYLEGQVLDFVVNHSGTATPLSASLWLALYIIALDDTSVALQAGNEGYNGYARLPINPGTAEWELVTGGTTFVRNKLIKTFASKADAGPITIVSAAVVDSGPAVDTPGNVLVYDFQLSIVIDQSEQPSVPVNSLTYEEI